MLAHPNHCLALAILPLLLAACSNPGERPAPILAAPATCAEFCGAFEEACGPADSCMQSCRSGEAVADFVGCQAAHAALTGCRLDRVDVCDGELIADLCVYEQEAYDACLTDACSVDPSSRICRDHCLATCYANPRCDSLPPASEVSCGEICGPLLDDRAGRGCATESWDMILCGLGEMPAAACSEEVCEAQELAFLECIGVDETGTGPTPTSAGYYEACNDASCDEGVCLELSTETTRGSMCAASCVSTADCPGSTAICMQTTSGAYCLERCIYSGQDCGRDMLCQWFDSARDYLCTPDV